MVPAGALEDSGDNSEGVQGKRAEGGPRVSASSCPDHPVYPLPHPPTVPHPPTHWSQTVSRAPGTGGELAPTAAFTQSHPRGGPVPLGLLCTDPKKLEMPLPVAQDYCFGGGNSVSKRPLLVLNSTPKQLYRNPFEFPVMFCKASTHPQLLEFYFFLLGASFPLTRVPNNLSLHPLKCSLLILTQTSSGYFNSHFL